MPGRAACTILLTALALLASCKAKETKLQFPNAPVILISVDTLRADHLPAYGYRGVSTPNIDALRKDATLFRNAYATAPMTLPSHVTILTGLLPPEHGVRDNAGFLFDAKAHPTIPTILHNAGYATGAAVSSYVIRGDTGLANAFDFYQDSIEAAPGARFRDYQRSGFTTESLAEPWIDQHASRPFFFFFHIYEPHVPYDPPEPFKSQYAANPYDGEIATSDAIVGRLLDHLKKLGLYDRAIIIFLSDHGEGLGDHGEQQHSVLIYRETVHVPLIIKLPKSARGGAEAVEPVSLADLVPTVTSLLGLEAPKQTSGLALFGKLPADRAIYSESLYARLHFGWGELKSITDQARQFIDSPRAELYDITRDAAEKNDLAPTSRREVATYRDRLAKMPVAESTPAPVDAEERAKLGALGYIAGTSGAKVMPVNPVDRIADLEELQRASRVAMDDMAAAQAIFRSVLSRNPEMVEAWVQLGDALARAGQPRQAIEAYSNAIAHSARPSGDVLFSLGNAYLMAGDLTRAAQCGEAALATAPHAGRVLLLDAALRRGDLATASRQFGLIERPTAADLVMAAEIAQRQGNLQETLSILDRAEQQAKAGGEGAIYRLEYLRADTYARMNRLPEATAAFEKEIAAFPHELAAYSHLSLVRAVAGDERGAFGALDRMLRANPTPEAQRVADDTRRALSR